MWPVARLVICTVRKPSMLKPITRLERKACILCHIPASTATTQTHQEQKFIFSYADRTHTLFHVSCYSVAALPVYRNIDLPPSQWPGKTFRATFKMLLATHATRSCWVWYTAALLWLLMRTICLVFVASVRKITQTAQRSVLMANAW